MIVGRAAEQSRINRLVADAKDGRGRSLVLRGEAGIGKTTLLDYAKSVAGGMRVLRVVGIESEADVAYAALHLLFMRDLDRVDALPSAQAEALRAAFGGSSAPVERGLTGAATLSLLSEISTERPLLCLLDDAQWFDQSSIDALVFAARRLHADPVALVFAARDGEHAFPVLGVDSVTLPRLGTADAARIATAEAALPSYVTHRIVTEAEGNPLAVVELAAHAADAPAVPAPITPLSAAGRLEEHFRRQVRELAEPTRTVLLLAAADHGSDLPTLVSAAEELDGGTVDFEPAERGRLVSVTAEGVVFRHPLIRSAVYQEAPFAHRIAAHRALARALSDPRDADRRAWHVAAAAGGPDDAAADGLEQVARRATGRGAAAAAARALDRAAQLTTSPGTRGRRLVAAARAAYDAGQLDRAVALATAGTELTDAPTDVAEAGWVRAQVAYEHASPAEATRLALDAAEPVLVTEPGLAVSILTEATWCARDTADQALLRRCAERLRAIPSGPTPVIDGLVGFAELLCGDVATAVEPMRGAFRTARGDSLESLNAGFIGLLIGEDESAVALLDAHVRRLRGRGALGWLPYAQEPLALAQMVTGRIRDADGNVEEAIALAGELGQRFQAVVLSAVSAWLAAVRGDGARAERLAATVLDDSRRHGMAVAQATWALGLIDLMGGDPERALDRFEGVCEGAPGRDVTVRAVPDHVEAAVRAGNTARAHRFLPVLADWARCTRSPVAAALLLRCQGLLDDGDGAQRLFEESLAIEGCGQYDRARTRLLFGTWLRRHRRRSAAREQLFEAHEVFDRIGAHGWLPRVRAELTALGEAAPGEPAPGGGDGLTPQELQVVRRAAKGMSNREIAAELFLSPRTVGHHLYKAYPKLRVRRRAELGQLDL
ncbi:helix-turn-helix transcriptional regulator [Allokutzneria sp. NRRL B-24872]|uniref:helix-turn-helix transcriptional regulator n=1 Tax=Allokutzneria sp. NRRL B-24872 TaxID=1137961 RepID=UPI00143D675E|nr:helix-turn-helix transcriptional regulator [Allokutzneria sp. NRRL B-24872]